MYRCSNGWIICLFNVTIFSFNDRVDTIMESFTCTYDMVSIDIREDSVNGGFQEIGHIVGKLINLPFVNAPCLIVKGI